MFLINLCNLFIGMRKLYKIIIKLIIINDLINLLNPLIIHEHLVIAVGDFLLLINKLFVLWFHLIS